MKTTVVLLVLLGLFGLAGAMDYEDQQAEQETVEQYVSLTPETHPEPPQPVNVYKHLARTIVGRDELVKGLEALLRAVGAGLPEGAPPLYWYRDEHVEAYRKTLDLAQRSSSELLTAVQAAKIKAPNMRKVQDLHDALAAAQIIPF